MKLKHLLASAVALLCAGGAWAYSTDDLKSAGWTQVTDFSTVSLTDNYFLFVDGQEGKYSVAHAMPKGIGASDVRRPVFQEIADPLSAYGQVWAIESYGEETYAIQSIVDDYYLNSNGQWWSSHVSSGKSDDSKNKIISLGEGKYRLQKNGTSTFWGPYNDNPTVALGNASGMDFASGASDSHYAALAANKAEANAPGFYIYAISRETYNAQRHHSSVLTANGWSKVTSTEGLGLAGYYYAFLDASENGGESGFAMTGTGGRPQYKLEADPITTRAQLWTTEAHGSGYAIKNVSDGKYIYAAASWNMQATDNVSTNNTDFIATYLENGAWTLSNSVSTSEFVGNYKNSPYNPTDGEDLAANKVAEKGKRTFLIYSIPTIAGVATALPESGDMAADTWYYIDITAAADNYAATATSLNDIVYTTDGTVLVRDGSTIVAQFTAEDNSLTVARYYVKSSSANNLVVAPKAFSYVVGEPTVSRSYVQPGQEVTVTYSALSTNDPDAALTKDFSGVTLNGDAISVTATDNGFTFTVSALAANGAYTLVIPAGAIGYAAGSLFNEVKNVTLNTPAAFDGTFFLRTPDGKYLSRGHSFNTRAIVDEFGLPVSMTTDANGNTQFVFVDSGKKLFDAGSATIYTDNTTNPNWTLEATTGGYYIINANSNGNKDKKVGLDESGNLMSNDGALVWTLEALSEHNTHMEALKEAQAAAAATAAGKSGITSKDELSAWLAEDYAPISVDVDAVTFTEKWNGAASASNDGAGAGLDFYTATKENLKPGIYKLTVNAYYRLNSSALAAEGARGNVYLFGNDVKTQLFAVHDFPASTPWVSGNDQSDAAGYYPNNGTGGKAALTAGNYLNELYVYVAADEGQETGTLKYGIHQPNRFSNYQWCGFQNFTLTYYSDEVSAEQVAALIATIPTDAMAKTDKDAIADAKANLEAEGGATIKNYNALNNAITAAATSIAEYKTYNWYVQALEANSATAAASVKAKYEAGTIESVEAMVSEFRSNLLETLATDEVTDYTAIIINPGFETGPTLDNYGVIGWDVNSAAGEAFISPNNDSRKFNPGNTGSNLFNTWNGSSFWLRQSFGVLPAGQYRLTGYLASDENTYTVKVGNAQTTVNTTGKFVGTLATVVFTSDGTTATQFDITTDKWFKADNFTLTLIGDGTAADITKLVAAINTPTSKLGFEDGEYAPYDNVDNITTINNIIAAVTSGTIGSYELANYLSQVEALTWKAHEGEVNAIYDGDFDAAKANVATNTLPKGWHGSDSHYSEGYWVRYMYSDGSQNKGLLHFTNGSAMMSKSTPRYGLDEGYTLPLKENTLYELTFDYAGWNSKLVTTVVVTDEKGNSIEVLPAKTEESAQNGESNTGDWKSYKGYFKTGDKGNYVLKFDKYEHDGAGGQVTWGAIKLFTAKATDLALNEATAYDHGFGYANVTLTRSIAADTWATFVVPFDIDNATLKAQLGDEVAVSTISADDKDGVTFTPMDEPAITANVPVIVKTTAAVSSIKVNGVFVKEAATTTNLATGLDIVANYGGADVAIPSKAGEDTNEYYYIASNKMKHSTGAQAIDGYRFYFRVAADAAAGIKAFFQGGDIATGIETVDNGQLTVDNEAGAVFNLAGQRVSRLQKGVNIVNGKKVLVK